MIDADRRRGGRPARRLPRAFVFFVAVAVGGGLACRKSTPPPPPPSTADGAAPEAFEPPPDGRLSERQAEMYVSVERRAPTSVLEPRFGAEGQELLEDLTRVSEAELAVALELGIGPSEFRWVKARVLEARLPELGAGVEGLATRMNRAALAELRRQRGKTSDPEERARLDGTISELEARLEAQSSESSETSGHLARQHNRELLERHLEE